MSATTTTGVPAASLARLLEDGAGARDIERHLDGLTPELRLAEVLGITGRGVGRLYDAVAGGARATLDELIPESAEADGRLLVYEGRNSMPALSRFQKRFARVEGRVVGYNHQTMSFATGPGYFVVHAPSGSGEHGDELDFDYTVAPPASVASMAGWPAYAPNERGLSRFVYGGMHDYVRRVARGMVVGKAYRHGAAQGAYFSLTLPG